MTEQPELMTADQVAKYFQISRTTLWRMRKDEVIKPVIIGSTVRYRRADIQRIIGQDSAG